MNFFGHLKTVNHHRRLVRKGCFALGLYYQGLTHDLSKYSPAEFLPGVKYYQGTRSPNAEEREQNGYSKAWLHHKGRNKHHFEYWTDIDPLTKAYHPVEIPPRYLAEMIMDRIAASKTYLGKNYTDAGALNYYSIAGETRFMNPDSSLKVRYILTLLAKKGEEDTFRFLREVLLKELPFDYAGELESLNAVEA